MEWRTTITTIAFDGKILAADKQTTWSGRPAPTVKIHKLQKSSGWQAIGHAGNSYHALLIKRWFNGELEKEPTLPTDSNAIVLLVDLNGRPYMSDRDLVPIPTNMVPWAIGSGGDFAIGAMMAGVPAGEAILIATECDTNTGMGVDEIEIKTSSD